MQQRPYADRSRPAPRGGGLLLLALLFGLIAVTHPVVVGAVGVTVAAAGLLLWRLAPRLRELANTTTRVGSSIRTGDGHPSPGGAERPHHE